MSDSPEFACLLRQAIWLDVSQLNPVESESPIDEQIPIK
jgi:hypothetical protein